MTTHATGPLAGLTWLKRGINLGRHNAGAVFGGAALLMFAWLVPSVFQVALLSILKPGTTGAAIIGLMTTLLAMALLPPMVGGYFRLIDASENGRPAVASDIFAPFRHGGGAGQLIGYGALMSLISTVFILALVALFGDGLAEWFGKLVELSQQGTGKVDPSQMPEAPAGLGGLVGLGSIVFLLFGAVNAIGLGQVALRRARLRTSIADGVVGTAKNLLPILLAAGVVALVALPFGLVLALVFMLLELVGSAIHPAFGAALVLAVYLAFLVAVYAVMFGVMYYLWRDVCGPSLPQEDESAPPPPSSNNHQIEL